MLKKITKVAIVLITSLIILSSKVKAEAPIIKIPETIPEKITYYSELYNVSEVQMTRIIKCESSFRPSATNITKWESSYGLVQINLKAHKNITIEQATDPDFAINFLAENLSQGRSYMWSCK